MNRFQKILTNKELQFAIIDKLNEIGYKQVPDSTFGDEDFIMIDTLRKEWIWCEFGFSPFCCDDEMTKYEFHKDPKSITLRLLDKKRY